MGKKARRREARLRDQAAWMAVNLLDYEPYQATPDRVSATLRVFDSYLRHGPDRIKAEKSAKPDLRVVQLK